MTSTLPESFRDHIRDYFKAHNGDLPEPGLLKCVFDELERVLFEETLRATKNNYVKAAFILGIHRNTLAAKIRTKSKKIRKKSGSKQIKRARK